MWKDFILVLNKLLEIYEEFLALSKQKRRAIVAVKMPELEKIVRQEQVLIASVGNLERRREEILTSLLAEEQITTPRKTLLDLLPYCDEKTARRLEEVHRRFRETLAALEECNEGNNRLLKQALTAVNYNLNVLTNVTVEPVYVAGGQEQVAAPQRFEVKA